MKTRTIKYNFKLKNILGGELPQNQWIEQTVARLIKKAEGIVSILTASSDVEVQMISPKGKVYTNKDSVITTGER